MLGRWTMSSLIGTMLPWNAAIVTQMVRLEAALDEYDSTISASGRYTREDGGTNRIKVTGITWVSTLTPALLFSQIGPRGSFLLHGAMPRRPEHIERKRA